MEKELISPPAAETLIPTITEHVDRRMSLLQATFDVIAASGFEGLRTRAVAERAGVNIATLHYYFPTKNALIQGLAEFLCGVFQTLHAPGLTATGRRAVDSLRQEFADMRFYREQHPQLMNVMGEMALRAKRDPAVQSAMDIMLISWRGSIASVVRQGISEGSFHPYLDPEQTIATLMAVLAGAQTLGMDSIENIRLGVEDWLLTPAVRDELKGAGK